MHRPTSGLIAVLTDCPTLPKNADPRTRFAPRATTDSATPFDAETRQCSVLAEWFLKQVAPADAIDAVWHYSPADDPTAVEMKSWFVRPHAADRISFQNQLRSLCRKAASSGVIQKRVLLDPTTTLLAIPERPASGGEDAIGVIVSQHTSNDALIRSLERLVQELGIRRMEQRLEKKNVQLEHSAAILELVELVLQSTSVEHATQQIASRVADHLSLHQVAIGLVHRTSKQCRMAAISNRNVRDAVAPATQEMVRRMDHAILTGESVRHDAPNSHQSQLTLPISDNRGQTLGAITAVCDAGEDSERVHRFLYASLPVLAVALRCVQDRKRGKSSQVISSLGKSKHSIAIVAGIAFLVACSFVRVSYRPSYPITVEPKLRRFVAAPFDARLSRCCVSPGDFVRTGDVLANLDGSELRLQRNSARAEYDQAIKKRDAAQASGAYGQHRLAQLEAERLRLQLELLDTRLEQLTLKSPIDGIVVAGDLQRAAGAPLEVGQTLFEIAPLGEMTGQLWIPDAEIANVRQGQTVSMRLKAFPNQSWTTTLDSVSPRSEIQDQQNVFIAECSIAAEHRELRPGMKGTAKVDCGQRTIAWILFHKPLNAIRGYWW